MAQLLRNFNTAVHKTILLIADISLIGMVILVSYTVFLRYCLNTGVGWAEEVPRLLVTLFAFLAMAMGVRDHLHIGVNIVYNLFPKGGGVRRFLEFFADFIVLLCGLYMLYYGFTRCWQLAHRPGTLPMTGLRTWWQYVPIPLAGFVISFDSILFLTGILKRDDLLYSEKEIDYEEEYKEQHKNDKKKAAAKETKQ